jgi:dTDP-4-dehydrorhamnose 3,5-epimerase-like enzyme
MQVIETKIPGLIIIEPDCHSDNRGWFMETYSEPKYAELGITNHLVQDNHSKSDMKGALRGLHFQNNPHAQANLVR